MHITTDWHIHSQNSCAQAQLPVNDLLVRSRDKGIVDFGLTDHLHTPFNLPDIEASRKEYLASNPPPRFHFGIEVSCVSSWELGEVASGKHTNPVYGIRAGGPAGKELAIGLTEKNIAEYGIEFVVGGTHWPLYVPVEREAVIRDYHRQNMYLAAHPLVDIVAHPWWWMGPWKDPSGQYTTDPWFDDFGKIPASMHDEFAACAREHQTAVEINIWAMLLNMEYSERFRLRYVDYLADLKSRGVTLSIGSDTHDAGYTVNFEQAATMLERVGIKDEELWRLPPRQ
jgi:histidinol phosphatase-like PHP family hydrolase